MSAEYQMMVGAPVIQSLDKVPPKQLGTESKKRVPGGGGLRADVIPQRRIILHRRITILLLEIGIEVRSPHAVGMMHGWLVIKGLLDEVTKVTAEVILVLLVCHGDEGAHGRFIQIVHHTGLAQIG